MRIVAMPGNTEANIGEKDIKNSRSEKNGKTPRELLHRPPFSSHVGLLD